jgi:hypothetical protein
VLKRQRGCPMRACRGPCGESGSRNGFAKSRALGARLLEGEGAGETGQWASSMLTGGSEGAAGTAEEGQGRSGMRKKKERRRAADRWGRAEGMTEKEGAAGMTEKRRK